jgi:hypothetical protein
LYLFLAAIVFLLLFAVSFSGRGTWVAFASSTLSALLVIGCAFIASSGSAGSYFVTLAGQTPSVLRPVVEDLAFAAEQTAKSFAEIGERPALGDVSPAPLTPSPDNSGGPDADWLSLSWLNPLQWFDSNEDGKPEVAVRAESNSPAVGTSAQELQPRAQQAAPSPAPVAPSYRIVAAPPQQTGPVTAPLSDPPTTPVKWLTGTSAPSGMDQILLAGKNVSSAALEDIQATLRPDSEAASIGTGNLTLSLSVEGPDGTATPSASVPPGALFYLQAKDLPGGTSKEFGGAIVSFAYSQDGRRRTSIMYLAENALNRDGPDPR